MKFLTAREIYKELNSIDWTKNKGAIEFHMAEIRSIVKTKDIIGFVLQNWLKDYFDKNKIYYRKPKNTQTFPDFYLSNRDDEYLLEIKTFNYQRTPGFDIANFESYCESIAIDSFRLDADYLIFSYHIDDYGYIEIKNIWLKKIWEIAGTSSRYPLKTQVKRNVIYNIRPNTAFQYGRKSTFNTKEDFLEALYLTLESYRGSDHAKQWLKNANDNIQSMLLKRIRY